ncbi:LOW QUALITY PROTEIN: alanine dehydrogenase [Geomicrobium sp. JCM 19038]|nr:LOW QUALITY PROTEIN: alanine dehydrogenase [Geomicrobium sp. JCM 19038]
MRIGIPKEVKNNENRVAITPAGVSQLKSAGHDVHIETEAGVASGFSDQEYHVAGAVIEPTAADVWKMEMVMKVKEPVASEYDYFYEGLILFAYLHLAAEPELTSALVSKKVTAIAFETVESEKRTLPLLTPMSEVAGRMASQIGAQFLEKPKGGKGILLSGIPGVPRGKVTVIGGGVVGTNAARSAIGLGANVTILDTNPVRLRELDELFGNQVTTVMSNPVSIHENVIDSDLVIGAVLIPGAKAPRLVRESTVQLMKAHSVIVDVAIDQGGIFETVDRVSTHDDPTYTKHDVVHYAVGNMPGAVPRTSTIGLSNVTIPYAAQIANDLEKALLHNVNLRKGLNTYRGQITYEAVATAHGSKYEPFAAV